MKTIAALMLAFVLVPAHAHIPSHCIPLWTEAAAKSEEVVRKLQTMRTITDATSRVLAQRGSETPLTDLLEAIAQMVKSLGPQSDAIAAAVTCTQRG